MRTREVILVYKRYLKLRAALMAGSIDRTYLAEQLSLSLKSVERSFVGRREWTLGECYKTLSILRIDPEKLPEYFPPNGGIAS